MILARKAGAKDGFVISKDTAQKSGIETGVPSQGNARAETTVVGIEGVFRMAANGANRLKPDSWIVDLPRQGRVVNVLQVRPRADGIDARIDRRVLHTVGFIRRHLGSPLQAVVQGQGWTNLPGIIVVKAVAVDVDRVREDLGSGQVEIAAAAHEQLSGGAKSTNGLIVGRIPEAVVT